MTATRDGARTTAGDRSGAWTLLALLAGVVALRAGDLAAPFFADDYLFLEQVRGRSLIGALFSTDPLGNFMRPVGRQLYFWLVSRAGAESAGLFHAINLALLAALAFLVYRIGRRFAGVGTGVFAASFVGMHYAADVPTLWA